MSVRISGPPPDRALPRFDVALLAVRADQVLGELGHERSELSLLLVDDAAMADMNDRFRGRSGPTDVLSFSLVEGECAEHRGALLGDVVIDVEQAHRQGREIGHGLDEEMARLLIHGVLHLLGYDHELADETRAMEAQEGRLWNAIAR